jgi:hypothetical protein
LPIWFPNRKTAFPIAKSLWRPPKPFCRRQNRFGNCPDHFSDGKIPLPDAQAGSPTAKPFRQLDERFFRGKNYRGYRQNRFPNGILVSPPAKRFRRRKKGFSYRKIVFANGKTILQTAKRFCRRQNDFADGKPAPAFAGRQLQVISLM